MSRTAIGCTLLLFLKRVWTSRETVLWPPVATCGYWEGVQERGEGCLCPTTNPSKTEGARPTEKRWFQAISLMQRETNCHLGAGVHNFRAPGGCTDEIL